METLAYPEAVLIAPPRAFDLDSKNVPGSPPTWFTYRTVNCLMEDPEFSGKFYIQEQPEHVCCTPITLVRQIHDTSIDELRSGKKAYLDLHSFQRENQAIYPSVEEVQISIRSAQGVDVVGAFAISEAWVSKFSTECVSSLARNNDVEIGVGILNLESSIHADSCAIASTQSRVP